MAHCKQVIRIYGKNADIAFLSTFYVFNTFWQYPCLIDSVKWNILLTDGRGVPVY